MEKLTTVGLDLAKSVFRFIASPKKEPLRRSHLLDFFRKLQLSIRGGRLISGLAPRMRSLRRVTRNGASVRAGWSRRGESQLYPQCRRN